MCRRVHPISRERSDNDRLFQLCERAGARARDVGDGRPVPPVTDPDGSVRGLIQDNEVIRNG